MREPRSRTVRRVPRNCLSIHPPPYLRHWPVRPGIGAVPPRAALHSHRRGARDARQPAGQRGQAAAHRRAVPRGPPRLVRATGLPRRGGARAGPDPGRGPRVRAGARRYAAQGSNPSLADCRWICHSHVQAPLWTAPLATTLDALLSRAAREARAGARPRALVACVPARSIGPGSQHPGRPLTAPAALPLAPGCPGPEQSARGAPVPCPRSPHPPRLATQGVRRTETWDLFVSELEAHGLAHADCTAEAHAAMEADDCPFWCAADEVARVRLLEVRWPEHRS